MKKILILLSITVAVMVSGCAKPQIVRIFPQEDLSRVAVEKIIEDKDLTSEEKAILIQMKMSEDIERKKRAVEMEKDNKLSNIINRPVTPLRTPDTILRVLILPYEDDNGVLNGWKYSYIKVDNGKWVMADYLSGSIPSSKMTLTPLSAESDNHIGNVGMAPAINNGDIKYTVKTVEENTEKELKQLKAEKKAAEKARKQAEKEQLKKEKALAKQNSKQVNNEHKQDTTNTVKQEELEQPKQEKEEVFIQPVNETEQEYELIFEEEPANSVSQQDYSPEPVNMMEQESKQELNKEPVQKENTNSVHPSIKDDRDSPAFKVDVKKGKEDIESNNKKSEPITVPIDEPAKSADKHDITLEEFEDKPSVKLDDKSSVEPDYSGGSDVDDVVIQDIDIGTETPTDSNMYNIETMPVNFTDQRDWENKMRYKVIGEVPEYMDDMNTLSLAGQSRHLEKLDYVIKDNANSTTNINADEDKVLYLSSDLWIT